MDISEWRSCSGIGCTIGIVLNINSENLAFLTANSLLQLFYKNQNAVTYVWV